MERYRTANRPRSGPNLLEPEFDGLKFGLFNGPIEPVSDPDLGPGWALLRPLTLGMSGLN